MEYRALGNTSMDVSVLGFGASSLGAEFREIDLNEAMSCVRVALDAGVNLIDTSPYYGRGLSESLLGMALKDVPRDSFYMCTKLGRYTEKHFDFSASRVEESIHTSLQRLKLDHLDIALCHDIEYTNLDQIVDETLPALQKMKEQGKVRHIGVSGYPMRIFEEITRRTKIDVILSYNHYTLQNTMLADQVETLKSRDVAIMNAAPFSARLLTTAPLPGWHKATDEVRAICKQAAEFCQRNGSDIAKLALQFSIANKDMPTCITGSANPQRVAQWLEWATEKIDENLLSDVLEILRPIHNWFYIEGRPENNDSPNSIGLEKEILATN